MADRTTVPRGRHAPPLEVRLGVQRGRLMAAAARVFAEVGYADATAETISRQAGMSKATFYEHFANKEQCITELFGDAASYLMRAMDDAAAATEPGDHQGMVHARVHAFLGALAAFPDQAQTLIVEIIGAGPQAARRRDEVLEEFAARIDEINEAAAQDGTTRRFTSQEESFAIVGAVIELASRHLRRGRPERIEDLEPVIERLVFGLLGLPAE